MVDTQKIQAAPRCISGVAEVAATLARQHEDHCTHAIEVATCFPLDVETVGRMLEGLGERAGIDLIQSDGVLYIYIERPDDYNLRMLDLDAAEHLTSNSSLLRHLSELRADPQWMRKVREQHELLRVAAAARTRRFELSYFTSRTELPSARIQSALNDLNASGHILVDIDEDADVVHYVFPDFDYPRARYQQNMRLLDELHPIEPGSRNLIALTIAALLLAALAVALFLMN